MGFPVFAQGDVLNASDMNAVGLWLVRSQAVGTGVTSVTVTNVFSSDYENYKIVYQGAASTTGECLRLQLGAVTTGYFGNLIYANVIGGAPASVGDNNTAAWTHCSGGNAGQTTFNVDLIGPFTTRAKTMVAHNYFDGGNAGQKVGLVTNTAQQTNFSLIVANGTITGGTIRVYGYRN